MRGVKSSAGKLYIETEHGEAVLLYRLEGGVLSVYHTFTPPEERGRGLAERLALEAVELAKRKGLKIKPECSYMEAFLQKHKEFRKYEVAPR